MGVNHPTRFSRVVIIYCQDDSVGTITPNVFYCFLIPDPSDAAEDGRTWPFISDSHKFIQANRIDSSLADVDSTRYSGSCFEPPHSTLEGSDVTVIADIG